MQLMGAFLELETNRSEDRAAFGLQKRHYNSVFKMPKCKFVLHSHPLVSFKLFVWRFAFGIGEFHSSNSSWSVLRHSWMCLSMRTLSSSP